MTILKQRLEHDRNNLEAARLILTDPDHYGGDEALAVRWARRVVARLEPIPKPERRQAA
jgi:hypothetical protein